ncbi:MAG: SDR family oxidoreductase, partial [Acidobacteria bacterium]|nr:SDR family oxidoreductase [Acidobacteriota bacterium]
MRGKICLITGATLGIGKETALGLARRGAHVVIVGRDADRTRTAADWIRREAGTEQVAFLLADLSSQADVRRLARGFRDTYSRLDVLVNNAGGIFTRRETTADGFERTWALNHLAYFLLTQELLELLKASAPARIVNVASTMHTGGVIDFGDLQGEKSYRAIRAYSQSKLANVLFTYALARRLQGTGVTANCLHPGGVATGFGQNTPGALKLLLRLAKPFLITAEQGAATSIHLASSPDVEGASGRYFTKCRPARSSSASHDEALQERLWALSLKQIGQDG